MDPKQACICLADPEPSCPQHGYGAAPATTLPEAFHAAAARAGNPPVDALAGLPSECTCADASRAWRCPTHHPSSAHADAVSALEGLRSQLAAVTRERDEARAECERLRAAIAWAARRCEQGYEAAYVGRELRAVLAADDAADV